MSFGAFEVSLYRIRLRINAIRWNAIRNFRRPRRLFFSPCFSFILSFIRFAVASHKLFSSLSTCRFFAFHHRARDKFAAACPSKVPSFSWVCSRPRIVRTWERDPSLHREVEHRSSTSLVCEFRFYITIIYFVEVHEVIGWLPTWYLWLFKLLRTARKFHRCIYISKMLAGGQSDRAKY